MTTNSNHAYGQLKRHFTGLHHLNHLGSIVGWDQAVMMPAQGNEARALAQAELQGVTHARMTDPQVKRWLDEAEQADLPTADRANLREMRREWESANLLPAELVQAQTLATSRCEHAWRSQRPANDWAGFAPNLKEVVKLARQQAQLLAEHAGTSRYDALMNLYEPGMTTAQVKAVFDDVKSWLPGLIQQALARQAEHDATVPLLRPQGPFTPEAQKALGQDVMRLLQFNFDAGRLDVSTHPFCGGVPEDVRITTRYRTDDFTQSLMGIVHETGHARYEQSLPRPWLGQPAARARSMGIHESQSLSFEMQLGRSRAFLSHIAPVVRQHLGEQAALSTDNLVRLYTRVQPGYIRVDADEITYPAHVILRFEIESALVNGDIEVDDIPALWDEKMQAYLGIDTRGNFKDGPMQDVHWPAGLLGYFPSYTLGAMYAAQYFATIRRGTPGLDAHIQAGDLQPVFTWLDTHIWSQASFLTTDELVRSATGEALNPAHFKAHLQARYLA